jgi:hypothetical protein
MRKRAETAVRKIQFDGSDSLWRLARETEKLAESTRVVGQKQRVFAIILSLLSQKCGISRSDAQSDPKFPSYRAKIHRLAFPHPRFRDEVFAAFKAHKHLDHILWIARGKPERKLKQHFVTGQFAKTIQKALDADYTREEIESLFHDTLHKT